MSWFVCSKGCNIIILLTVEKCIRGGIYHSIYHYAKAKNKYIKYYD